MLDVRLLLGLAAPVVIGLFGFVLYVVAKLLFVLLRGTLGSVRSQTSWVYILGNRKAL